jgi:hypothetical protein
MTRLSVDEQLDAAALVMLTDGLQHAPKALAWAIGRIGWQRAREIAREARKPPAPLSLRELSLGAQTRWHVPA